MTLPLMRARAGDRGGQRPAGAARIALLAMLLGGLLVSAAVGGPARAADSDPYSATVTVDATADSVVKARDMARLDGQRRAFAAVVQQLSGNPAAKLPKLDDNAITDLVASFQVADERMSSVRYVADYTFHFRAAAVRRVLQGAGIALSAQPGKPVVVVPVYQANGRTTLWEEPNPWRQAWDQRLAEGSASLVLPLGDAGDIAAIDADKARAGDADALAALARHNGGGDAVVALAAMRGPGNGSAGVDVTLRRYRDGQLVDSRTEALNADPGENDDDLLRRAVAAIVADIASGRKSEPVANVDQEGTLTAVLPITSLDDWVGARGRLAGVPAIRKIELLALSRQEATIEIGYSGSIDQLKTGLAQIRLDLVRGDPLWRLARIGAGGVP